MNNILAQALNVTRTSAEGAAYNVGFRYRDEQGRQFEYVQFKEATIKGSPVAYKYSASLNVVTNVYSASLAIGTAGVCVVSGGAAASYGWIQVQGIGYVNLRVTGTVGALGLASFTETGKASVVLTTAGRAAGFAWCLAAKSGTVVLAGKYRIQQAFK